MLATIALLLALPSFALTLVMFRQYRKLKPTIAKAMGIIGSIGRTERTNKEELADIEEALTDGVLDMVMQKYPEAGLVMAYLEENNPEIMEKIKARPSIVIGLVNKYAPLIGQLTGKGGAKSEMVFDV